MLSSLTLLALLGACGGGGNDDSDDGGGSGGQSDTPSGTSEERSPAADSSGGGSGSSTGEVEFTAEAGEAWVEVDGKEIVYAAASSIHFSCDIGDSQLLINFQTADGHDLLIQGAKQGEDWFGSLTFKDASASNVQYGGELFTDATRVGLGDAALSFADIVTRVEDFDVANGEDMEARIAVNCDLGSPAMVTIDGETHEFPLSGAQSLACDVGEDGFEINISRPVDGTNFEMSARKEGEMWLGAVSVRTATGQYLSTIPDDGAGMEIDGRTVRYSGTFEDRVNGGEVEGVAEAICP